MRIHLGIIWEYKKDSGKSGASYNLGHLDQFPREKFIQNPEEPVW